MKLDVIIKVLFQTLALMALLNGCDGEVPLTDGEFSPVHVHLFPTQMEDGVVKGIEGEIDEGGSADYSVCDFWLFEYDHNNNILGTPRYYTIDDSVESVPVSAILPTSETTVYKVVIIANTHNSSLLSDISYNTLDALKSSHKAIRSCNDLHQGDDLIMNAVADIRSTTSDIQCYLYRNVAKLSLTIDNASGSGVTLSSIQVKSVPDRLFFADRLYENEDLSPSVSSVVFQNFTKDDLNLEPAQSKTVIYYLPRNMRGVNMSTTESGKNLNAPEGATYVEISATVNATGKSMVYRFYPGANSVNDFNIHPNHLYEMNVAISSSGDKNDNRVEDASLVRLEESNSYIINPSKGTDVEYLVPIENRINTFWRSEVGRQNPAWESYLIDQGLEWVAEVIWQDVAGKQVVDFAGAASYVGAPDERFFPFSLTENAKDTPCNVLIGVRSAKDDWSAETDGYMWSWHLWITDYDPDVDKMPWTEGKYLYEVPNGSVHKYSSFERIPIYKNSYIMDRNLGAKGYTREDGWALCAGMLYQFGRKDPFPPSDIIYSINGAQRSNVSKSSGPRPMYESVAYPVNFVTNRGDWTSNVEYRSSNWNDLHRAAVKGEGKSFFDPCPPGWKLPVNSIWTEFGNKAANVVYASNWAGADPDQNSYATNAANAGWMIYLDGESASEETIYFPGSGMRNYSDAIYSGGGMGAMWAANQGDSDNSTGVYLYYENRSGFFWLPAQSFYRSMGLSVRCITDN